MKSVSLCNCLFMSSGSVSVASALSTISLWCNACIHLKYCLLVSLVSGSGGDYVEWGVFELMFCTVLLAGGCDACVPFSVPLLCVGAALCE